MGFIMDFYKFNKTKEGGNYMQITKVKTKKKKLLLRQRMIGLAMFGLCIMAIFLASKGRTPEEKDIGIVLFLIPLSLYMVFTREIIIG